MSPGLAVARRTQGAAKAHDSGDIMSDPPDLNLNDLEELVRDAFHVRDEAVPSDEVVRAQARIVKGVLMADSAIFAAAVPIAAQEIVDARLDGGK